ncbi:MAG: L,D-transpeptidase family protein [Cyclobacteriaceae bacterium]
MKNLGFLVILIASACQSFRDQPVFTASPVEASGSFLLDTVHFQIQDLNCRRAVRVFYASHNYALFWRDNGVADSLIEVIENAARFGLLPEDYHIRELKELSLDTLSPGRVSKMDVLLTDGYLTLHYHIRNGRLDPATLQRRSLALLHDEEGIASLQHNATGSINQKLLLREPVSRSYHLLKDALKSFDLLGKNDSIQRDRAKKIALNMERWRWQKPWPDRYVLVNIPAFSMRVVESDSVWLESRVIVGKRDTPTPLMQSVIRSFIIYPYWHVPYSISTKEILPALQASSSYLQRNNFEVLDKRGNVILPDTIQWDFYDEKNFPFVLRQREGSENSMGVIKFNFFNNYNVYLHDTNSKRLFKNAKRDFSHGCVRVDQAVTLAHYLVREDDIYVSPEDLDQYLSLQQRLKIDLRKPITVKLEYFTSEVVNGVTFFYDDIYKKDSVMMRSLYWPVTTPAIALDNASF